MLGSTERFNVDGKRGKRRVGGKRNEKKAKSEH
jgi:hypothetical protein